MSDPRFVGFKKEPLIMFVSMILAVMLPVTAPQAPEAVIDPTPQERVLVDFSETAAGPEWRTVNDNVMGGISKGGSQVVDGTLVFSGETRLENNGGFSSIRSAAFEWKLGGAKELVLRVRGDSSRSYTMLLQSGARRWGMPVSYWHQFEIEGEEWQVVRLPLEGFYPTSFGRTLEGPDLDLEGVRSIGFMVYDKLAGSFRLEADWIKVSHKAAVKVSSEGEVGTPDLVSLARTSGKFKTLLTAAQAAGLVETLAGPGPFTILAPTDEAFAALPEGVLESLLEPRNRARLEAVLLYHVLPGVSRANQLAGSDSIASLQGQTVSVAILEGQLRIGGARVILNDLEASNGIVHAIDTVLIPTLEPTPSPTITLIEAAISRAVPLFNRGEVEACSAIYEITATALVDLAIPEVTKEMRAELAKALQAARNEKDRRVAAWSLRRALDSVWSALSR